MKTRFEIRPATLADASLLARTMRLGFETYGAFGLELVTYTRPV